MSVWAREDGDEGDRADSVGPTRHTHRDRTRYQFGPRSGRNWGGVGRKGGGLRPTWLELFSFRFIPYLQIQINLQIWTSKSCGKWVLQFNIQFDHPSINFILYYIFFLASLSLLFCIFKPKFRANSCYHLIVVFLLLLLLLLFECTSKQEFQHDT
jgi:hypothetical protein